MQEVTAGGTRRNHSALAVWTVLAVLVAGVLLRGLRLDWQPLWWDEGYSMYFASEPLARMVELTANDIHPPLYYGLLKIWMGVLSGKETPESGRLLSVLFGALALPLQYWLARAMFPQGRRLALLALLLLVFSPIHLYYSQEVRMYGLALALGLAAALALWRWVKRLQSGAAGLRRTWWPAFVYLLAGLAALYTLYYAALLLLAQAIWAIVQLRKNLRALLSLLGVYLLMFLLYLPWLLYAVPKLAGYVGGKVQSDQDSPLGPLAYVERHLAAFTAGPVQLGVLPAEWLALAPATIALCAIILGLVLRQTLRTNGRADTRLGGGSGVAALWVWVLAPLLLGWLINLRLPFFPAGGERLLLTTLPYFLLLLAYGVDRTWNVAHLGKLAAAALAVNAGLGITAFYMTPRYAADDYRALIRQVHQQGNDNDALLTIFPWQVGYWRAYDPYDSSSWPRGPQPLLLSNTAAEWSPSVAATIDSALQKGTLWFPEPLTFGSSLPHEIEQYLEQNAVNLENRWYDATRLTGWARLPSPATQPVGADFGLVQLREAGIAPSSVESANQAVAAALTWEGTADSGLDSGSSEPDGAAPEINVSLRLQDAGGRVWVSREYARSLPAAGEIVSETVGLIAPVGLPPGGYQVAVSVQTAAGEPLTIDGSDATAAVVGEVEITQPPEAQSAIRLPIEHRLEQPAERDGLALFGYSGPGQGSPLLAGTELAATLFLENYQSQRLDHKVYLSLLDATGAGVAGYEGWPLPAYPASAWPESALMQVPVAFYLPGALASDDYQLVAGLLDPATGSKTPPVKLATIAVERRTGSFTRPTPSRPLADPPQLGTHARLLGYDLAEKPGGQTLVMLYWELLQPLLPPHHIFVHLDAAGGEASVQTRAQQDGPPATASGLAPTGSWLPGEFLITQHLLPVTPGPGDVLSVGLYDPKTQVRLPVTVNGQATGDSVGLQMGVGE